MDEPVGLAETDLDTDRAPKPEAATTLPSVVSTDTPEAGRTITRVRVFVPMPPEGLSGRLDALLGAGISEKVVALRILDEALPSYLVALAQGQPQNQSAAWDDTGRAYETSRRLPAADLRLAKAAFRPARHMATKRVWTASGFGGDAALGRPRLDSYSSFGQVVSVAECRFSF